MELVVERADGPVDVAPLISVLEAPQNVPFDSTIDVVDAAGHAWRSESVLESGTSPSEPWWSMDFVSTDVAATTFALLLLSGGADDMWRSDEIAAHIIRQRDRDDDRHIAFAEAGHFLRPPSRPPPFRTTTTSGRAALLTATRAPSATVG